MNREDATGREPIDPGVDIGHVHLKVADIDRALGFWRDVLGFELTGAARRSAAFLSAGGYHHHIGLNTWESSGGPPPPRGTTGLYHVAIRYPTRAALADALRRVARGRASSLTAPQITASARPSTCVTLTATESSCTGIAPESSGHAQRMVAWPWSPSASTWATFWASLSSEQPLRPANRPLSSRGERCRAARSARAHRPAMRPCCVRRSE